MEFLAAVSTKDRSVQSRFAVLRIESLSFEGDVSLGRFSNRSVDHSGAGDELVQLKGEERAAPRPATLALGAAHEDQHRLQLAPATLRIASGLFRQEVCCLPNGDRATPG